MSEPPQVESAIDVMAPAGRKSSRPEQANAQTAFATSSGWLALDRGEAVGNHCIVFSLTTGVMSVAMTPGRIS